MNIDAVHAAALAKNGDLWIAALGVELTVGSILAVVEKIREKS